MEDRVLKVAILLVADELAAAIEQVEVSQALYDEANKEKELYMERYKGPGYNWSRDIELEDIEMSRRRHLVKAKDDLLDGFLKLVRKVREEGV